jgi:hypothetical protein
MEPNCRLTLESSDYFAYCNGWWDFQLEMNVIGHEMSFEFFDFHLSKEISENFSEMFSIFPIEDSFTKLWTNDDMIGTIPPNMSSVSVFLI